MVFKLNFDLLFWIFNFLGIILNISSFCIAISGQMPYAIALHVYGLQNIPWR